MMEFDAFAVAYMGTTVLGCVWLVVWQRRHERWGWRRIARSSAWMAGLLPLFLIMLGVGDLYLLGVAVPLFVVGGVVTFRSDQELRRERLSAIADDKLAAMLLQGPPALQAQNEDDIRVEVTRADSRSLFSFRLPLMVGAMALALGYWWFAGAAGVLAGFTYLREKMTKEDGGNTLSDKPPRRDTSGSSLGP